MKKRFAMAVMACLFLPCAMAQEINTIFMTTHNDDGSVLPILIKKGRTLDASGTEVGSWLDGTRTQDCYFGLRRYDQDRLLLGVFSNGINENDPDDNQELAQEYPDRSLIWINAKTGKPMGIALVIGLKPVEPSDAFKTAYGADISFFMAFDISDEGYIYVAFGDHILRYKPDSNGGFTGPEDVFQLDVDTYGPEDWGINAFNVQGSGKDTVITGGQNSKGFFITTTDGDTFTVTSTYERSGWPGLGGAQSNIITNSAMQEDWIFVSGYGNFSGGNDSSFYRLVRNAENPTEPFVSDNDFFEALGKPDATGDADYQANYIGGVGGANGLPYVVAYSTPSWNSSIKLTPGFLALHDITAYELYAEKDGAYISNITIPVYTTEEPSRPTETTSDWSGTQGTVEVNIPSGADAGACEILWGGGIYGYGRFSVGNINEPVRVSEWALY